MKPSPAPDLVAYAGRWVARVRGKVVGQGRTREEALRAAQHLRPKDTPEIVFVPLDPADPTNSVLQSILGALPQDQPIYLVGGAVRDKLIGRKSGDLDFAVPKGALRLARRVARATGGAFFPLDDETDTGRIVYVHEDGERTLADFAAYRRPDLPADLSARDFTINAIALDPRTDEVFDPLDGTKDLRAKRIRACTDESLSADPVRVLRAVRLAATLRFSIERPTRELMKSAVPLMTRVSPERLRDELFKMLDGPQPATAVRALDLLGALPYLLPELSSLKGVSQPAPHVQDVWAHTLSVVAHLEKILEELEPGRVPGEETDLFSGLISLRLGRYREQFAAHFAGDPASDLTPRAQLLFAALYHDVAKPQTRATHEGRVRFLGHDELGAKVAVERARSLRLSNDAATRIGTVIAQHMRIHFYAKRRADKAALPSRRAIYRFFRDAGAAGPELCLLGLADARATYEQTLTQDLWTAYLDVCRELLENWWEKPQESISPPSLVNGHDLMEALDLTPGPSVGHALDAVREAQATGVLPAEATREDALAFAKEWLEKKGGQ
jgi:putative nucleotidyltransferase with HDIG domain